MAESKTVIIVPLKGSNYSMWKVQCRMVLMKEGLWSIVRGTEVAPSEEVEQNVRFVVKRDRTLVLIMLFINPTLLYLLGDLEDPVTVWKKLNPISFKRRPGRSTGIKEEVVFPETEGERFCRWAHSQINGTFWASCCNRWSCEGGGPRCSLVSKLAWVIQYACHSLSLKWKALVENSSARNWKCFVLTGKESINPQSLKNS